MLTFLARLAPHDVSARLRETLQHSQLAQRLARGAAWSLIGAISTRVLTLVSSIIVVRLLGKVTLGEFGMVQSTLAMLGTFAGMGLGMTATKYTAEFRERDPARVGRVLAVTIAVGCLSGFIMTVAGWVASEWLAERVLERAALAPYLRLSAVLVLMGVVDGVLNAALAGFEAFGRVAKVSIYVAIVNVLLTVPLVYWFGLYGAVAALIASTAMHLVLTGIALVDVCKRRGIKVRLDRLANQEWPILVHYALPALGAGIVVIPATWLVNVILVRSDNGFAAMGVIKVVDTLRNLAIYLPTVLLAPTFAVLSNVANEPESVRKTMRFAIGTSAVTVLPLALMITALARHVLGTLYGDEFAGEGLTLALAMIVLAIQATGAAVGNYINATGRMWLALSINLLWGVVFVGLAVVAVPRFGSVGYVGSMAMAYLTIILIAYSVLLIKWPKLMGGYPLCRSLLLFGLLMPIAVYTDRHATLPIAAVIALVLGFVMSVAVALPMIARSQDGLPPGAFEVSGSMYESNE
jgi:O-antigen/teichoic acid export membrane protein